MVGKIGDKVIALKEEKQSILEKTVKKIKKTKEEKELKQNAGDTRGIILVNHIPHGFFEEEMRDYFSQFGRVLRLRLARSIKTGNIKGYAFVEFQYQEVAKIAAETMNNYLMFERLIKCQLLPPKTTAEAAKLFAANKISKTSYPKLRTRNRVKLIQSQKNSEEIEDGFRQFRLTRLEKSNKKLADLGISYQFDVNNQKTAEPTEQKPKRKSVKTKTPAPDISVEQAKTENSTTEVRMSRKRSSQIEDIKTSPKTPKMENNRKIQGEQSPEKTLTTKSPRFSPKMLIDRKSEGEHPQKLTPKMLNNRKSETKQTIAEMNVKKSPRFSPKMLIDRKSEGEHPQKQQTPKMAKSPKNAEADQNLETNLKKSPRFSPKMLIDRKSEGEHPQKQQTPKMEINIKSGSQQASEENKVSKSPRFSPKLLNERKSEGEHPQKHNIVAKTPKTPKFSPKMRTDIKSEEEHPDKLSIAAKTPKTPKFSPKMLRSRKSVGPVKQEEVAKTPKMTKPSPKILRSRKSEGTPLSKPPQEDNMKSAKSATKPVRGRKSEMLQVQKQDTTTTDTPEKSKFSPKLLRSRKSEGPVTPKVTNKRQSVSQAKPATPKVSPKSTRKGRKSVM